MNEYINSEQVSMKILFLIFFQLKKMRESIEDCSSALALDEKYMKALLRRAKSYLELEMFDEAVRDYEAALR